jgi:hypothetical protein
MKRWRFICASLAGAAVLSALTGLAYVYSLGRPPLGKDLETSHVVIDRAGKLLRAYATSEGRWRLPASVKDVDPRFLKMLFAYEDKRFYEHDGVDAAAMARAAFQLVKQRHIVSGGSTLTMQVARLLEPREKRSFSAKLRQITRAFELEHALGKNEILALYLTLAPYGGNLEGIRAASLSYFGKEPRKLSLSEAALLVALPQSPELRRPDRFPQAARAARDRVLDRAAAAGVAPRDEIGRAKSQDVPHERKPLPVLAPHSADQVIGSEPDVRIHRLTIDAGLQKTLQDLARERARALGPQVSVAILAVDNETGEVRARVGSADYFDARRAGQVDMTQALRSPGSTLKPFIYGLAFEDGLLHPETLIDDKPARYGSYTPENFDLTFQGTVTVRRALQMSLNVPAIAVLSKVGVSRLSARLTQTASARGIRTGAHRMRRRTSATGAPAARSGRRLVRRKYSDRRAAAGQCGARTHRFQDRHLVRIPRRLVGRFRWPHDHRGLGRTGRRRAGARSGRARGGGADLVRRLRAQRQPAGPADACAQGRGVRHHQQTTGAAATLHSRKRCGRRVGAAAHHVSARRRAHRTRQRRRRGRRRTQDRRRRGTAHRYGQWRAAGASREPAHNVLCARRPGLRAAHCRGRPRRHRQRQHPPAITLSSVCNDSAGARAYCPGKCPESAEKPIDEHGQ